MRVFFIENENPARTSSGGIMSYLINLSAYLSGQQVETILVGAGELKNDSVANTKFSRYIPVTVTPDVSNFGYIFSLLRNVRKINLQPADIVHAQRPDMLFPIILFGINKNRVCSLHGAHDLAVYDKKGKLYGFIYSVLQYLAFKKAAVLIAVDAATQQHYFKKYPWAQHKTKMIPIGIDFNKFKPLDKTESKKQYGFSENEKVIVFVGRLEKEKNVSFLIESFRVVLQQNKNAKLVIVGNGREKQKLVSLVSDLKMNEQIVFMGELSNNEIPLIINAADVFAFCSLYEGSPTVIKEALACNIPVVSVDVGDVKKVVSEVAGSFISERDPHKFAQAISNVFNDSVKHNSRDAIRHYSHTAVGEQTLRLYSEILM